MTSFADGAVIIQISSESVPSTPCWLGLIPPTSKASREQTLEMPGW